MCTSVSETCWGSCAFSILQCGVNEASSLCVAQHSVAALLACVSHAAFAVILMMQSGARQLWSLCCERRPQKPWGGNLWCPCERGLLA